MESRRKKSKKVIEALASQPELTFSESLVWKVFSILSASRPSGFGPGHIPISEIRCISFMTMEDDEDLIVMIKAMDEVWLDWAGKQSKANGTDRSPS